MEDSGNTWPIDVVRTRIRGLGWLTIALALAPVSGLLLAALLDVLLSEKGHNPWLTVGNPWGAVLMVVAFVAPIHVPYTILLWLAARGLFRHRPWARVITLILTPFAVALTLLFGGGIVAALFNLSAEGNRGSSVTMSIVAFSPLTLTSAAYCLCAHSLLWRTEVRAAFTSPPETDAIEHRGRDA
jgi:hypothetical protein